MERRRNRSNTSRARVRRSEAAPDYSAALTEALRKQGLSQTAIEQFSLHSANFSASRQLPCPYCFVEGQHGVLAVLVASKKGQVAQCPRCKNGIEVGPTPR